MRSTFQIYRNLQFTEVKTHSKTSSKLTEEFSFLMFVFQFCHEMEVFKRLRGKKKCHVLIYLAVKTENFIFDQLTRSFNALHFLYILNY